MILGEKYIRQVFANKVWKAYRDGVRISDSDLRINPNSVNVSLSNEFMLMCPITPSRVVDFCDPDSIVFENYKNDNIILRPDENVLACTRESFDTEEPIHNYINTIPMFENMYFKQDINGRSTVGRCFTMIHVTAGYGDYGFKNQWTLEIKNLNPFPIKLHAGMQIAQISFRQVLGPGIYGGSYSAAQGVTAPLLGRDRFFMPGE